MKSVYIIFQRFECYRVKRANKIVAGSPFDEVSLVSIDIILFCICKQNTKKKQSQNLNKRTSIALCAKKNAL